MTTSLMSSTKDRLISGLKEHLTTVTTLLARGVSERDGDEAQPGTPLFDSRVLLGLDGRTGARDVRSDVPCEDPECWNEGGVCTGRSAVPRVLTVDPGVQVEQEAGR